MSRSFSWSRIRNPFGGSTASTAQPTTEDENSTRLFESRSGRSLDTSWSSDDDDAGVGKTPPVQRIIRKTSQLWSVQNPPAHNATPVRQTSLADMSSASDVVTPRRSVSSPSLPRLSPSSSSRSPSPSFSNDPPSSASSRRRIRNALAASGLTSRTDDQVAASPTGVAGLPRPPSREGSSSSVRGSKTSLKSILKRSTSPSDLANVDQTLSVSSQPKDSQTPGGTRLRWVADDDFEIAEISARQSASGSASETEDPRPVEPRDYEMEGESGSSSAGSEDMEMVSDRDRKTSSSSRGTSDMSLVDPAESSSDDAVGRHYAAREGSTSPKYSPPTSDAEGRSSFRRAASTSPTTSPPPLVAPHLIIDGGEDDVKEAEDSFDPSSLYASHASNGTAYQQSPLRQRQARLLAATTPKSAPDESIEADSFDAESLLHIEDGSAAIVELSSGVHDEEAVSGETPADQEEADNLGVDWGWRTGGRTGFPSPLREEESWELRELSVDEDFDSRLARSEAGPRSTSRSPTPLAGPSRTRLSGSGDSTPIRLSRAGSTTPLGSPRSTSPMVVHSTSITPARAAAPEEEAEVFSTPARWMAVSPSSNATTSESESDAEGSEDLLAGLHAEDETDEYRIFATPAATPSRQVATSTMITPVSSRMASPSSASKAENKLSTPQIAASIPLPASPVEVPSPPRSAPSSRRTTPVKDVVSPRNVPLPATPELDDQPSLPEVQESPTPRSREITPVPESPSAPIQATTPPNQVVMPPFRTPRSSDRPAQVVPGRSPAWQLSVVRTPSRLVQSFTPGSPSSASEGGSEVDGASSFGGSPARNNLSVEEVALALAQREESPTRRRGVKSISPPKTPPQGLRRTDSAPVIMNAGNESIFPSSPFNGNGEVRIVSRSAEQLPNRWQTRQHNQSFALSTPSKSFHLDFTSPAAIRDWSIQRSMEMEAEELAMSIEQGGLEDEPTELALEAEESGEAVVEEANGSLAEVSPQNEGAHAPEEEQGLLPNAHSELSYLGPEHIEGPSFGSKDDGLKYSLFDPRVSIAPLADFSPIGLPSLGKVRADARRPEEESPLAKRVGIPSSASAPAFLGRTLALPDFSPLRIPAQRAVSSPARVEEDQTLHDMAHMIPSPDNTPPKESELVQRPSVLETPARTVAMGRTAYFSPSLFLEQPSMIGESDESALALVPVGEADVLAESTEDEERFVKLVRGLISAQDALLTHRGQRYGIVMSLAENLRQDLVIKEEMVSLLNEDKVRAEAARDDAIEKARLLQRRVKDAADTQDAERKKHSAKVEGLVAKLSTEISASNMAQRINPELGRLTAQLEEARSAVVSVQPLLDSYRQANAELDAANIAQAAELADLRRTAATSDPDLLAERDEAIRELREALAAKDQELDGLMDAREDRSTVSAGTRGSSQRRIEMLEEELDLQWQTAEQLAVEKKALQEQTRRLEEEKAAFRAQMDRLEGQHMTIAAEREQMIGDMAAKVTMLEREQHDRLEALSELRSRAQAAEDLAAQAFVARDRAVVDTLELAKNVQRLQTENAGLSEALDAQKSATAELKRLKFDFMAYQVDAESTLRSKQEEIDELHGNGAASNGSCGACSAAENRVKVLEVELGKQKAQTAKARIQSADQEMKLSAMRKTREELKEDILGLNVALEAKQQEVAYLKRQLRRESVTAPGAPATALKPRTARKAGDFTKVLETPMITDTAPRRRPLAEVANTATTPPVTVRHDKAPAASAVADLTSKLKALPSAPSTALAKRRASLVRTSSDKENLSPGIASAQEAARTRIKLRRMSLVE